MASSKRTPCLRSLVLALASSHSNQTMHDEYNSIAVTTELLFLGLGGIPHPQIVSIPVGANLPRTYAAHKKSASRTAVTIKWMKRMTTSRILTSYQNPC